MIAGFCNEKDERKQKSPRACTPARGNEHNVSRGVLSGDEPLDGLPSQARLLTNGHTGQAAMPPWLGLWANQ